METQQQNIRSWDDLIFENRNKAYGAYAIRQAYSGGVTKGVITCLGIFVSFIILAGFGKQNSIISNPILKGPIVVGDLPNIKPDVSIEPPAKRERTPQGNLPPRASTEPDPAPPVDEPVTTTTSATGTEGTSGATDTGNSTGSGDAGAGTAGTHPVEANKEPVTFAEVMPSYKGGMEGMAKTLKKNMRYPEAAKRMGKEGTVYVEFVVTEWGDITGVKLVKGFDLDCDKEAVRIVGKLNEWNPGMQNKIPVNVKLVLPVKFKLEH